MHVQNNESSQSESESSDEDNIDGDGVPDISRDEELLLEFERVIIQFPLNS